MQTSLKQQPKSKGQRLLMRIWQDRVLYLLLAPAMLYFVFFRLWPIWNMRLAFFNYKARSEWTWAGLKWFEIIFSSNGFFTILGNTLRISFMKYVLMFPFSVAFAILLNELRSSRMRKLVQVSTYLPHFLSWVVIAGIFINILSPTGGILNDFRALFGLPAVDYMTQKDTIMGVLFASSLWRSLGWDSIIYFAAIIGINQSLYEAAYMDGATRMQVIRYVVLPALITPMVTTFILNLGFFLDAGFDQVFNFTNDAVNSTIDILDTYIYRLGLTQGQYEVSTAVGLLKGVVGVVLARDPDSSVFGIVSFAWAGFGGSFGAVVLCALFWKRCNWQGALAGMLCGGLVVFVWKYIISPLGGVFGIYELLPAFLVSLAVCAVVSLVTPAPTEDILAEFDAAK